MLNSKEIETIDHSIKKIKDDFQSLDENLLIYSVITKINFESGLQKNILKINQSYLCIITLLIAVAEN